MPGKVGRRVCTYAMDICSGEVPLWDEIKSGHSIASHLYDEKPGDRAEVKTYYVKMESVEI
ncbi:hypothetical protein V1498_12150 [Peribacillus sp. SCS-26]|uniref:hypothetical protein n=1 Tax=Paraperibacillus marinus TaxID=3115295 RepID=UPI0039060DE3